MERIMGDFKSKLPDLKEVMQITGKLFKDLKTSVGEIVSDYKQKHADTAETEKSEAAEPATKTKKVKESSETTEKDKE